MRKKILFALAVLAIVYFLFLRKKAVAKPTETSSAMPGISNDNQINSERVLKRGSKGSEVLKLQSSLNDMNWYENFEGFEPIAVDGDFGPNTERLLFNLTGLKMIALEGDNNTFKDETLIANFNPQL